MTQSATTALPTPAAGRHQPSSAYVDQAFYDWLTEVSLDLDLAAVRTPSAPPALREEVIQLLTLESRLLDQHAYDTWLDLFTAECAYWIPSTRPARDPRKTITLEFHDQRRLRDRIGRLGTGLAYSQLPASRTARQFSGVEVWPSPGREDEWRVRCSVVLVESRQGRNRTLGGWHGFVLRREGEALRIVVKQVNLLDCDSPQGNNSFFL